MNRHLLLVAVIAMAATASCKKNEPTAGETGVPGGTATVPAATALPDPVPTATATATQPVDTAAANEIPSALQGMWGMNEADCDRSRGDAKGNLRIGPKKLEFFESVARLGKIKERDASRIRATYGFEGEGQTWTMDVVLDVQDGGRRLVRRDYGPDAIPGPLQYLRCS